MHVSTDMRAYSERSISTWVARNQVCGSLVHFFIISEKVKHMRRLRRDDFKRTDDCGHMKSGSLMRGRAEQCAFQFSGAKMRTDRFLSIY